MQELLIATKNPGKFREITEFLDGLPLRAVFLGDLKTSDEVPDEELEEDGTTFKENAYKKAEYYFRGSGLPVLAEDSGILIDALEGELGIKTRRWGVGEKASDEEWIEHFLKRMEKVENRRAAFVCSACFFNGEEALFFEGKTVGRITRELEAPLIPGIPLSSCFIPEGEEKVYAALTVSEKNKISHRGKAMSKLRSFLMKGL